MCKGVIKSAEPESNQRPEDNSLSSSILHNGHV